MRFDRKADKLNDIYMMVSMMKTLEEEVQCNLWCITTQQLHNASRTFQMVRKVFHQRA